MYNAKKILLAVLFSHPYLVSLLFCHSATPKFVIHYILIATYSHIVVVVQL